MKYDFLIVGAGITGATFAEQLHKKGKKVLVIDKRNHIGGNVYTGKVDGIDVHEYGPHIFHTNDVSIWEYVNKFAKFNSFTNRPIANYKGEIYSLPFNMYTFNKLWGVISPEEAISKIKEQTKSFSKDPRNLEEQAISLVGADIYQKLIKGYTEKQWGRDCKDLPAFIIKRLPVRFTYDNNYYNALYQGIPYEGYTELIRMMLHGVDVWVGVDYFASGHDIDNIAEKIIFTGSIDEFFGYALGRLQYRSVRFETEYLNIDNYQGNAVVNYTDAETPYTRIIEHKWFNNNNNANGHTIISREYSNEWALGADPYYPINDSKNILLYNKYKEMASKCAKNVIFAGRLGEYKYYDMDQAIKAAMDKCSELCKEG